MTKQSIYPTLRQKAFFESYDVGVQQYHLITSGSIMYFRFVFRMIILIYTLLAIMGGFELLSIVLVEDAYAKSQMVTAGVAGSMLVLTVTMGMIHNQILLILGHGYKSSESQLYVDRLTLKEDCGVSVVIIRSMYLIAIVVAAVMLWILWGGIGTPMYSGALGEQLAAANHFFGNTETITNIKPVKPFLWFSSMGLLSILFMAILGWIQATIARAKI